MHSLYNYMCTWTSIRHQPLMCRKNGGEAFHPAKQICPNFVVHGNRENPWEGSQLKKIHRKLLDRNHIIINTQWPKPQSIKPHPSVYTITHRVLSIKEGSKQVSLLPATPCRLKGKKHIKGKSLINPTTCTCARLAPISSLKHPGLIGKRNIMTGAQIIKACLESNAIQLLYILQLAYFMC